MAGLGWLLASPLEERRDWLRLRGRTGQKSFPRARLGRRPAVWGFYVDPQRFGGSDRIYAWQYSGCPMKAGNLSESRPHQTAFDAFGMRDYIGMAGGDCIPAGAISRKRPWFDLGNPGQGGRPPPRLIPPSRVSRTPRRCGSSSGGCSRPPYWFPTGPLRHLQLSRLHHRPGRRDPGTGGRPPPPRRDRECDTRPQVRRRVEPHAVRPLRRQRRLAGRPGDGPQPGPLDRAHRPGRADRDHQDPQATVLLPGRTAHPLGAPPHPASAPALALGNPVQSRPGPAARPATPSLTTRLQLTRHPAN